MYKIRSLFELHPSQPLRMQTTIPQFGGDELAIDPAAWRDIKDHIQIIQITPLGSPLTVRLNRYDNVGDVVVFVYPVTTMAMIKDAVSASIHVPAKSLHCGKPGQMTVEDLGVLHTPSPSIALTYQS
jgi:hypothetical protein